MTYQVQYNAFKFKDTAYGVGWDARDEQKVIKFFQKCHNAVRHNKRIDFVRNHFPFMLKWWHPEYEYKYQRLFRQFLEKRKDDHRIKLEGIEDIQFCISDDMVLYRGLEQCNKLILKTSTTTWTIMGIGTDGSTAYPFQIGLVAQVSTITLTTSPNYEQTNGTSLEFVGYWPNTLATGTYKEVGVSGSGIGYLTRNVMTTSMGQSAGSTAFSTAVIMDFVPVVS